MPNSYDTYLSKRSPHSFGHFRNTTYPHEFDLYSIQHPLFDPRNYYPFQKCHPRVMTKHPDEMHSETGEPRITKDGYQVSLDVHQFDPNEITVKIEGDSIVVKAAHGATPDEHGYVSRQFIRQFNLPMGFGSDRVVAELSSDGILTIKIAPEHKASNRILQIQYTGPAHYHVKDKDEAADEDKHKGADEDKDEGIQHSEP